MSGGGCYQYQQTGQCRFGDSCRFSHGGAMGSGNGGGMGGGDAAFGGGWGRQDAGGYGRPAFGGGFQGGYGGASFGRPQGGGGPCYSFQESGQCRFGDSCRYSHGDASGYGQQAQGWGAPSGFGARRPMGNSNSICYTFRDSGSCKFGDSCRYSHAADGGMGSNDGYNRGPRFGGAGGSGSNVCYSFQQSGACKFGDSCRFSHSSEAGMKKDEQPQDQTGSDGQPHMEG